jgi:hypothetical protein
MPPCSTKYSPYLAFGWDMRLPIEDWRPSVPSTSPEDKGYEEHVKVLVLV